MSAVLECQKLAQSLGQNGELLFENVSLSWKGPSLQVIMGGSGSGKSTLLKCLAGVWKASRGTVVLNGEALSPALLRRIGFAFQNNALFTSMRVIENLSYPHRQRFPEITESERQEIALSWLEKVGLEASAYQYPYELSGGMQKRLAIARALILKPDFIFLDDPTAGLDPVSSRRMSKLLASLLEASRALVVIVTNDPDQAKNWGPHIHFLVDRQLLSPQSAGYEKTFKRFFFK